MNNQSSIAGVFEAVGQQGRLAFMPFITAGDPDLETMLEIIRELSRQGVDLIEIGFPYSDPIADGPVIQASYTRALEHGVTVDSILAAVSQLKSEAGIPPLVAMVSYAIVYRQGVQSFVHAAKETGFAGLIIPDLPGDEAADCFERLTAEGLDLIQLLAPTTPPERARHILKFCSGFVYCIAVSGTTGERDRVADALLQQLKWVRQETSLPLAVGFGISRAEHVKSLKGLAHGVIVGSGIVRHLERIAAGDPTSRVISDLSAFAADMVAATQG